MGRGLPTGGQGSKVYVLRAEPKEHKHFRGYRVGRIGYPARRIGDRVTEKLFMCQMFISLFRPLMIENEKRGHPLGLYAHHPKPLGGDAYSVHLQGVGTHL